MKLCNYVKNFNSVFFLETKQIWRKMLKQNDNAPLLMHYFMVQKIISIYRASIDIFFITVLKRKVKRNNVKETAQKTYKQRNKSKWKNTLVQTRQSCGTEFNPLQPGQC